MPETGGLNESQRRRLLASAQHADKLIAGVEEILNAAQSKSPFPKYRPDLSLHQARLIRSHLARFRDHLSRVLAAAGVAAGGPALGSLHSIRVMLTFIRIAVQEMAPEYLRGYGELSDSAAAELRGLCAELGGLMDSLERNLALGEAVDLQARLDRLERTTREADLLRLLDRVIQENELAEFRAALLNVVEKLESPQFEIAVFGRVSSGKSSLLNRVLNTDVLPVGATPITAVPTRLVFGREARLTVTFADRQVRQCPLEDLADYASEERNPGNRLGVSRLVVALPSSRLEEGLVLVDTPGLGALASGGAAETLSYLPQCDLGILLISAVNPVNEEDLNTIHALSQAGIPVMGLLSKADLLSPSDRDKALDYTRKEIFANLGLRMEVCPVSAVAQEAKLLEDWFRDHLAPLFRRHRELAKQSIRRKAGVLRESVMAALRSKLGAAGRMAESGTSFEEVERRLRTAAGEIEQARRFCLDATDDVRALGEIALRRAAEAVLESWDVRDSAVPAGAELIRQAAEGLAVEAASQISERLAGLAHHLQSALAIAAQALRCESAGLDEPLEGCLREMPRLEFVLPEVDLAPPWFSPLRRITRIWVARRLRRSAAAAVEAAFTNYGRALEAWVRRVLAELQSRFDASADAHRAQLARLMKQKVLTPEERASIERNLAELEGMAAGVGD